MRTLFLLFFVVVLSGCSARLDHDPDERGDRQALTLRALLDNRGESTPASKAPLSTPDGAFPDGTHLFGIVQMSDDPSVAYATGSENVWAENVVFAGSETWRFKPEGASTATSDLPPLYVGRSMRVSAYYPYQSGRSYSSVYNGVPLVFDLTTAAEQNNQTDLLYCPEVVLEANGYASRELTLSFRHFYALLEFQIKLDRASDMASKITKVAVMNNTGKKNLCARGLYCPSVGDLAGVNESSYTTGVVLNTAVDLSTEYATIQVMIPPASIPSYYVTGDLYVQFYDNDVALAAPFLIQKAHMSAIGSGRYVGGLKYAYRLKYSKIGSGALVQVPWESGGATGDLGTGVGNGLVQITSWETVSVQGVFGSERAVLEYGVAPHAVTTGLSGSTTTSYNAWKGTVAAPTVNGGNGAYYTSEATAYRSEKPYYKFEVAPANETSSLAWQAARAACWAKAPVGQWRLPRVSEMRLIYLNKVFLEALSGFTMFSSSSYWSATENDGAYAWTMFLSNGSTSNMLKTSSSVARVRCVREGPASPTVANPPTASDYVTIDGLKWAKGNLVAVDRFNAKVGASTDYGLYFHFGSLVGWSGGANGSGVGTGSPALAIQVKPNGYTGSVAWPAGYYTDGTSGTEYGLPDTDDVSTGIGDPCRVYLGADWRTPTATEYSNLFDGKTIQTAWSAVSGWDWQATPAGALSTSSLFFPASGYRNYSNGSFNLVTTSGYGWSSSVGNATSGLGLHFNSSWVYPQSSTNRSYGFPVRCVSGTYAPPPTVANPPAASDYVTIDGLKWAKGNLVATNASNAKVGAATDYGLYFHFGSLVGWSGGANGSGVGTGEPDLAIQVKPNGYSGNLTWPAGYYTDGTSGTEYGLPDTDDVSTGIGDPCRVYLGADWRTPTATEYSNLFDGKTIQTAWSAVSGWDWQATPAGALSTSSLFFPASGYRNYSNGSFYDVTTVGYGWSSSVYNATGGLYMDLNSSDVYPQLGNNRSYGFPVRCVGSAP